MTQDSLMTKPIGAPAGVESPLSDQARGRRHLGGWQIDTGDLSSDELTPVVTGGLDAAPIDTEALLATDLSTTSVSPQTTPFLASIAARLVQTQTAPVENQAFDPEPPGTIAFARGNPTQPESLAQTAQVADQTVNLEAGPSGTSASDLGDTVRFEPAEVTDSSLHGSNDDELAMTKPISAVTPSVDSPMPEIAAVTMQIQAPTTTISAETHLIHTATMPIAVATTPISYATMQNSVATDSLVAGTAQVTQGTAPFAPIGSESGVSTETLAEIARLRSRVAEKPDDSDALFELAVALHRSGMRNDARESLTTLVTLYEQRGQHQQAARIKGMLGAPKTGPITTEELPPRSVTATDVIGRTAPLRNVTGIIGKNREVAKKSPSVVHAFPPENMLFTIPLPGQDDLDDEVIEILKQSDEELSRKQLAAALDSCIQVLGLAPDYNLIHLRFAEIYTRQRLTRRARAQAEALVRLADATGERDDLWMVYRVILHASGGDTASLRRLVELLIEAGRTDQASIYASRLIQILDAEGLEQEALSYSIRLCDLIPGDTRAALENAILRLKNSDRGGALDRWESAVARGADPIVAKASIAALTTTINEDDHWRMLADVVAVIRSGKDRAIVDAYARTAAMMPESATLIAGHGLMLTAVDDSEGRGLLAQAAGARNGAPMSRAVASVALAATLAQDGRIDEYVAAVRTALKLLQDDAVATHPAWKGLVGQLPRFEDLSLELGDALLARGDAAGAAEVLKAGHARSRHYGPMCEKLAEAYFKIGQLGSALTVLDELAVHYRSTGQLEAMAGVLRQMSQLAPNNIKVKSRLIDAYLQRGFVAEARAEMIQRADLEERSGLIKDAVTSLQRAADLSWTIGLADETFSLYTRVIEMAPDDVGNRSALVNFYLQMGKLSEAAEHQRAVVDIALRNNHRHEAIAALHQVIGLTPDDTTAYYQLADLLASMGEYRQAEKVYRRLVLMNPADPIAQAKATSMASLHET